MAELGSRAMNKVMQESALWFVQHRILAMTEVQPTCSASSSYHEKPTAEDLHLCRYAIAAVVFPPPLLCHHLPHDKGVRRRAAILFPNPLFSVHRVHLGNLRDDLFADDLDRTQDVRLGMHNEPQQHVRGPECS
jgi:hypothetical protein